MDTNKLLMLINLVPFGLFCLFFPRFCGKLIIAFLKIVKKLMNRKVDDNQLDIKDFYIRLLGGACISLAILFFFDFIDISEYRSE